MLKRYVYGMAGMASEVSPEASDEEDNHGIEAKATPRGKITTKRSDSAEERSDSDDESVEGNIEDHDEDDSGSALSNAELEEMARSLLMKRKFLVGETDHSRLEFKRLGLFKKGGILTEEELAAEQNEDSEDDEEDDEEEENDDEEDDDDEAAGYSSEEEQKLRQRVPKKIRIGLERYIVPTKKDRFTCNLCEPKVILGDYISVSKHLESKRHVATMRRQRIESMSDERIAQLKEKKRIRLEKNKQNRAEKGVDASKDGQEGKKSRKRHRRRLCKKKRLQMKEEGSKTTTESQSDEPKSISAPTNTTTKTLEAAKKKGIKKNETKQSHATPHDGKDQPTSKPASKSKAVEAGAKLNSGDKSKNSTLSNGEVKGTKRKEPSETIEATPTALNSKGQSKKTSAANKKTKSAEEPAKSPAETEKPKGKSIRDAPKPKKSKKAT